MNNAHETKEPPAAATTSGDEQKEKAMKDIQLFDFNNNEVRVLNKDGEPWFVGKEICTILDIKNANDALSRIDEDGVGIADLTDRLGRVQKTKIINEAGLYELIFQSRVSEAKAFKRWVTHEVLPAIRKHGGYLTPEKVQEALLNPDTIIQLATNLKHEQEKNRALEAQAKANQPKVVFADAVSAADNTILIGDLAKLLCQNGIKIGQKRLFEWMRQNGYLIKGARSDRNRPTQKWVEKGLFKVKETPIFHNAGHTTVGITTKVTGKGQQYFIDLFLAGKAVTA